jgi:hypothetical protein
MSQGSISAELKVESILLEEFRYGSRLITQVQQDRSNLFNIYLIIAGVIATALGTVQTVITNKIIEGKDLALVAGCGLILASLLSLAFFTRLLGLARTHREGVIIITRIREFYIQQFEGQVPLRRVLCPRFSTTSNIGRAGSSTFLIGCTIVSLGSFYLSGAVGLLVYALLPPFGPSTPYSMTDGLILTGPIFVISLMLYLLYYRMKLNRSNTVRAIELSEQLAPTAPPDQRERRPADDESESA